MKVLNIEDDPALSQGVSEGLRTAGYEVLAVATGQEGLFINGSFELLTHQVIAILAVAAFSFTATWLIATAISRTIGFRVLRDDELTGLDTTYHAESAYDITGNSNRY